MSINNPAPPPHDFHRWRETVLMIHAQRLALDYMIHEEDYHAHPNGGGHVHNSAHVPEDVHLKETSVVGAGSRIDSHSSIGDSVLIGKGVNIRGNAQIGQFVLLDDNSSIDTGVLIMNRDALLNDIPREASEGAECRTHIGPKVHVGEGSVIFEDVTLEGNNEVGPYGMVGPQQEIPQNERVATDPSCLGLVEKPKPPLQPPPNTARTSEVSRLLRSVRKGPESQLFVAQGASIVR